MINIIVEKWKKMPDAARSSVAFVLASFLIKGISFITTPIFTRLLDSEQYGLVATYNSWASILEVFAVLGITYAGVFNVGLNDHKYMRDKYTSTVLLLCNTVTIILFIIIMVLKILFGTDFILPTNLLIIMFMQFLFGPAQTFWITRQRYEYKYKMAFVITVVSAFISQLMAVFAILLCETPNLTGSFKIWSTNIGLLIVEIPIYIMLLKRGKFVFDKSICKQTLIFAIPLIPHYLAQHVMGSSDRIMISYLDSNTGAAIYSVVSNISLISSILWSSINNSLIPYTFEKIENKKEEDINKIVLPILVFYAVTCVGVSLIAPEVLMILAPEEYYGGIYAVPPIASTAFFAALYNVYANIEFYHKKATWIATSTMISAITNVVLNYCLIPKMGYIAAAYTTLISNVVLIMMHFLGYRKSHKTQIYNDKSILLLTLITVGCCVSCNLLYKNIYLRYIAILLIITAMFTNRKTIYKKYNELKEKNS